ncbi:MAG TPA: DUF5752 family protein [Gemmatimonadota bacterium]|jgi:hypothetical protein
MTSADRPFQFYQICRLTELTGRTAHTVRELRSGLIEAPAACIFYHTHHAFLRAHRFVSDFTNDFARWATEAVQQFRLGERLGGVDLLDYTDLEALRAAFVHILDEDIRENGPRVREAAQDHDFHFVRARTIVYPIDPPVRTVEELAAVVKTVPSDSIFYHFFEARLRPGAQTNDFSHWLFTEAHEPELAMRIERLDPYVLDLEELRGRMLEVLTGGRAA